MAKAHSKTVLAFGDVHIPYQQTGAVEVFCRAAERLRPDLVVCLGDLLDCSQLVWIQRRVTQYRNILPKIANDEGLSEADEGHKPFIG